MEIVMSGTSSRAWVAVGLAGLLACSGIAIAQEPRDETLKKLLERYPAADANKDGKLSLEEARAYRIHSWRRLRRWRQKHCQCRGDQAVS